MAVNSEGLNKFVNSSEFKKRSGYLADDVSKFSFKWIGISIRAFIGFIKSMISMVLGK